MPLDQRVPLDQRKAHVTLASNFCCKGWHEHASSSRPSILDSVRAGLHSVCGQSPNGEKKVTYQRRYLSRIVPTRHVVPNPLQYAHCQVQSMLRCEIRIEGLRTFPTCCWVMLAEPLQIMKGIVKLTEVLCNRS